MAAPIIVEGGALSIGPGASSHFHSHEHHEYNYFSTPRPTLSEDDIKRVAQKFKETLRDYYQIQGTIERLFMDNEEPIAIKRGYINLCAIKHLNYKEEKIALESIPKERETIHDALLQTYEALHNVERTKWITPEELFIQSNQESQANSGVSKPINRILIHGRAGIGKSTLCRYLIHQWANEQLWQEDSLKSRFELVVWIPLRKLSLYASNNSQRLSIAEFLRYHSDMSSYLEKKELTEQEISECLVKLSDNILYILDGYDEIASLLNEHPIWKLIDINALANKPQWIITSRPCNKLPLTLVDSQLEIRGFTDENILEYVHSYFRGGDTESIERKEKLITLLEKNRAVWGVAHIPINLELLCFVSEREYEEQEIDAQNMTMTLLYKRLSDCLLNIYLNDEHRGYPRYLKDKSKHIRGTALPENFTPVVNTIGAIALRGLITQVLIIPSRLIKQVCHQLSQDMHEIIKIGLLKGTGKYGDTDNDYYFLHLTFQEYYAAQHIVNALLSNNASWGLKDYQCKGKKANEYNHFQNVEAFIQYHKYDRLYEVVWWFVSGLLAAQSQKMTKRFFDIINQPPYDMLRLRHSVLTIRLLEENVTRDGDIQLDDTSQRIESIKSSIYAVALHCSGVGENGFSEQLAYSLGLSPRLVQKHGLLNPLLEIVMKADTRVIHFSQLLRKNSVVFPTNIIVLLVRYLENKNQFVRLTAAHMLARQTAPLEESVIEALVKHLNDEEEYQNVKRAVAYAIDRQPDLKPHVTFAIIAYYDECNQSKNVTGRECLLRRNAYDRLFILSNDEDLTIRNATKFVRQCISQQNSNNLNSVFIELLNHQDAIIREITIIAISSYNVTTTLERDVIQVLVECFNHDKAFAVRKAAGGALALQAILLNKHIDILLTCLKQETQAVKKAAIFALSKTVFSEGNQNAFNALLACLESEDLTVKEVTLSTLQNKIICDNTEDSIWTCIQPSEIFDPLKLTKDVIKILIKYLSDKDLVVRRATACALGYKAELGDDNINALVACLEHKNQVVRETAAEALYSQNELDNNRVSILIACLESKSVYVKKVAANILGRQIALRDNTIDALVTLFYSEEDLMVKQAAANALAQENIIFRLLSCYTKYPTTIKLAVASVIVMGFVRTGNSIYRDAKNQIYFQQNEQHFYFDSEDAKYFESAIMEYQQEFFSSNIYSEEKINHDVRASSHLTVASKTHVSTFKANTASRNPIGRPTEGGGDCGLHAVLGRECSDGIVRYDDIAVARASMRQAIIIGQLNTADLEKQARFNDLIINGIRDWIMSDIAFKANSKAQALKKHFYDYTVKNNQQISAGCKYLESVFKKAEYFHVYKYIEHHHRLDRSAPFHRKFSNALLDQVEEDTETLRGMIYSIPVLEEAFQSWNMATQKGYNWADEIAKFPGVRAEFAEFVGAARQWLTALELNIIAYVFDRTVCYQPAPGATEEIFNPGCDVIVSVVFNGEDHFEQTSVTKIKNSDDSSLDRRVYSMTTLIALNSSIIQNEKETTPEKDERHSSFQKKAATCIIS